MIFEEPIEPTGNIYASNEEVWVEFNRHLWMRAYLSEDAIIEWVLDPDFDPPAKSIRGSRLRRGELSLEIKGSPFICELKRISKTLFGFYGNGTVRFDRRGRVHALSLEYVMNGSHIYGFGEKFDAVDQSGRTPLCRVEEKFTEQGAQTYLPIPFCFTERGVGLYRSTGMNVSYNLSVSGTVKLSQRTPRGGVLFRDYLFAGPPDMQIRRLHALTGSPSLPPEWAFGPWISANGWNSDREVEAQLAAMKTHDYPAAVIVLEAWSDERTFYIWNDEAHFRDPAALIKKLRTAGLRVVLWQIPVIKYEWEGEPGEALLADEAEAIEKGYCVMRGDGTPYRITDKWFHNSLVLDFTNPKAAEWWFKKREYLLDMGIEGFKTDGGEFLFGDDLRLYDGTEGETAHNLYPNAYIHAYQAFMKKKGVQGVTFSRAGFTGSQALPIHWAGDQLSNFSELKAQLNAGISAGLSGILFWGFDIGGFAGPLPGAELYLRATAMAAFCPIMQWHAEPRSGQYGGRAGEINDRSPWNLARVYADPSIIDIAAAFARIRMKLLPYIWAEAQYAAEHSRPLMAHLIYDFPDDPNVYDISDQYMFGRELLIAPIIEQGAHARRVYIPAGKWTGYFDGRPIEGGQWIEAECPLNSIPVYKREEI